MNDALKIENNDIMNKFQKTENILNDVQNIIEVSQKEAYRAVNTILSQRNWLIGYRIAEEELLGEIGAALQKKREIAVDVEVKAPTEKTVNMSAELTAEQGWTMQEITDAVTAALQAYFTGERLGEAVYTAKLASILYGVEGVKNCHLLTPDEDVSVSATELPVLGTVTITEIGAGEA